MSATMIWKMCIRDSSDTAVGSGAAEHIEKVNPIVAALDFIAGCMTPLFTAIIAGGLVKVLLVIFGPTLLNVMQTTSDTYILMNALGDAPFYFLPVLVAFTASRKLNLSLIHISSVFNFDTGDTPWVHAAAGIKIRGIFCAEHRAVGMSLSLIHI